MVAKTAPRRHSPRLVALALAVAGVAGACATPSNAQRADGAAFDIYCGQAERCYQEARARCGASEAVITEQRGAKNRRDLRVVCKAG